MLCYEIRQVKFFKLLVHYRFVFTRLVNVLTQWLGFNRGFLTEALVVLISKKEVRRSHL